MPRYTNINGKAVSPDIALDASGSLRAGYRSVLQPGESLRFDLSMHDAATPGALAQFMTDGAPVGFVGPAEARQREIMADVASTAAARTIVRDALVREAVAATMADRAAGRSNDAVAAMRNVRTTGFNIASAPAFARDTAPDNSAVVASIRASRYA